MKITKLFIFVLLILAVIVALFLNWLLPAERPKQWFKDELQNEYMNTYTPDVDCPSECKG